MAGHVSKLGEALEKLSWGAASLLQSVPAFHALGQLWLDGRRTAWAPSALELGKASGSWPRISRQALSRQGL